ncbi:MAG: SDR family NAD(P)-dependent oxidoreductase [Acidimicrobiales bacterium]
MAPGLGETAVVTGAASGIGLSIVKKFAGEHMRVVLADIDSDALNNAVQEVRDTGADVEGVVTDVSDVESVTRLRDAAKTKLGAIDVVVSNAGVMGFNDGHLWQASAADWEWTLGVNFGGGQNMLRVFLPDMVERDKGYFVITSSIVATWSAGGLYGISKHALLALGEALYGDLAGIKSNVGVSVLLPTGTVTNLFSGVHTPDRLADSVTPIGDRGSAIRSRLGTSVAEHGDHPDKVADKLLEGMRARQLYIPIGEGEDERTRARMQAILSHTNPA